MQLLVMIFSGNIVEIVLQGTSDFFEYNLKLIYQKLIEDVFQIADFGTEDVTTLYMT